MTLLEYLAAHPIDPDKPFKPTTWYNADGDMIECFLKPDQCYAKQLTPGISVFYSMDTDEIVGVQIHGIQRMIGLPESKP